MAVLLEWQGRKNWRFCSLIFLFQAGHVVGSHRRTEQSVVLLEPYPGGVDTLYEVRGRSTCPHLLKNASKASAVALVVILNEPLLYGGVDGLAPSLVVPPQFLPDSPHGDMAVRVGLMCYLEHIP